MLVISRKNGQRIFIGDQAFIITVLNVDRDWVELGFDAPERIRIYREEIFPNKLQSKQPMEDMPCTTNP